MSTISVIMCVYNGEEHVRSAIRCVLSQTFRDYEFIIINDGSTDSSLSIIASFNDSRVRIFSYPKTGLATCRNRALNLAKGEYVAFIDADDLWMEDKLKMQHDLFCNSPKVAVVYSWVDFIDKNSKWLHRGSHRKYFGNVYKRILIDNFIEGGLSALIRKVAIKDVGGFDDSLEAAEDYDACIRLAKKYEFVCLPQVLMFYRRSVGMSTNIERQECYCLKVINEAFSEVPAALQFLRKQAYANIYQYLFHQSYFSDLQPIQVFKYLRLAIIMNTRSMLLQKAAMGLFEGLMIIFIPRTLLIRSITFIHSFFSIPRDRKRILF